MAKTQLSFRTSTSESISLSDLNRHVSMWLMTGDIANHSPKTLALRRLIGDKLLWFLRTKGYDGCDLESLRAFFYYIKHGHKEPGVRWGNPQNARPAGDRTQKD